MKKVVYKCPKCGSTNIGPFMGFETGMQYQCLDCGYIGVLVIKEVRGRK